MARTRLQQGSTYQDAGRLFAPCRAACPVHIDVPGYLTAIAEGRFTDALEIVLERNPLPSVCGRVCLRPCEDGCRRCQLDAPVAIASLKRAAADHGVYPRPLQALPRGGKIAVVGGGPTGLTAAHDLANLGFSVTIFDAKEKLGGMLRYGIPNYRLPDKALDRDIDYILGRGVDVRTGVKVGTDITLDELTDEYDAVLITAGLQGSRKLPIGGTDLAQVYAALPFLEAAATGDPLPVGERVLVVGGGNVAMDVARTARRVGAKHVETVCLESREEMPASDWEVHEAELEGVKVNCSWGPVCVLGEDGVVGLSAKKCLSVFDADKRFAPTFDEEMVNEFAADTVIFATGQGADVADLGLPLTPRGSIEIDPLTLRTGRDKVYAAGDVVSGPTKVVDAIAAGQRAAASIWRDITGDKSLVEQLDIENAVLGKVPDAMGTKLEQKRRIEMEKLEFYDAVKSFEEVELGYTEYEAAREAQRCLGCTTGARLEREKCASCLTCMRVCPHGAPTIKVGGYVYFDANACHACGACASQCPAQAIHIEGYSEEEIDRRAAIALTNSGLDTSMQFACSCTPILPDLGLSDVRTITLTCLLRVSERAVLHALNNGAQRVVFSGCVESNCRYPYARPLVARRIEDIRSLLAQAGIEGAFIVPEETDEDTAVQLR